jgi:hypothetical protein
MCTEVLVLLGEVVKSSTLGGCGLLAISLAPDLFTHSHHHHSSPRQPYDYPATWRAQTCHPCINARKAESYCYMVADKPKHRRCPFRHQAHRTSLVLPARDYKYDVLELLKLFAVYRYQLVKILAMPVSHGHRRCQRRSKRPPPVYRHLRAAHKLPPRDASSFPTMRQPVSTICTTENGPL